MSDAKQTEKRKLSFAHNGYGKAKKFFLDDLWELDTACLPRVKRFFIYICRVIGIVIRGFLDDNCILQASALSYTTLVSLIPMMAIMFMGAAGFGFQKQLERILVDYVQYLPEDAGKTIMEIFKYVAYTPSYTAIGIVGIGVTFLAMLKVMGKVELTFNTIWGVKEPRTFLRKCTDYTMTLFVTPFFILVSTSINALLSSDKIVGFLQEWTGPLSFIYSQLITFSGLFFIGLAFTFLYLFLPNTKVKFTSGLAGGLAAGILWFAVQKLYIELQVGITKANAVYGTFAAVPFFLTWLYSGWVVMLFGAEISFAVQNHSTYRLEGAASKATVATKVQLAFLVMHRICKDFVDGNTPWSIENFSREQNIPIRLLAEVTYHLSKANILIPTDEKSTHFTLKKDIEQITFQDIEEAFRGKADPEVERLVRKLAQPIRKRFVEHHSAFVASLSEINFREVTKET